MKIEIKMLNIGNGDAIIVYLFDNDRRFVCVIDAGHKRDANIMLEALKPYLDRAGKVAPDLIVCTHYDADHIGGMLPIVQHYLKQGHKVGEVWIHGPNKQLEEVVKVLYRTLEKRRIVDLDRDLKILNENQELLRARESKIIIESYRQMLEFVDYLNANRIKWSHPFAGTSSLPDFPEVEVLGPTKTYYEQLFPPGRTGKSILSEELVETRKSDEHRPRYIGEPCSFLDNNPRDRVTSTNLASVILLIQTDEGSFLFTGDAGLDSFGVIKDPEKLEDIFWLKVPHHGSHNNMSTKYIEKMRPRFAFVSGAGHVDQEVVDCLRKHGCKVSVTFEEGTDLHWPP